MPCAKRFPASAPRWPESAPASVSEPGSPASPDFPISSLPVSRPTCVPKTSRRPTKRSTAMPKRPDRHWRMSAPRRIALGSHISTSPRAPRAFSPRPRALPSNRMRRASTAPFPSSQPYSALRRIRRTACSSPWGKWPQRARSWPKSSGHSSGNAPPACSRCSPTRWT